MESIAFYIDELHVKYVKHSEPFDFDAMYRRMNITWSIPTAANLLIIVFDWTGCKFKGSNSNSTLCKIVTLCIWLRIKKSGYFTIQLIFATIYGSYRTFWFYLYMGLIVLFQLIFTLIYNTFRKKFQFQQSKRIPKL